MSTVSWHDVVEPELRTWLLDRTLARLERGEGLLRAQLETVRLESLRAAGSCLYSGDMDDARRFFADAAKYAGLALAQPAGPEGPQVSDVGIGHPSMRTQLESIAPMTTGYGGARMSATDFSGGLMTLVGFGSSEALRMAAETPEADYRSPGLVMEEWGWRTIEAYKDLTLGKDEEALNRLRAVEAQVNASVRCVLTALTHLLGGDERAFKSSLLNVLKDHKKRAAKAPADMSGLVCMPGMMLCRVALRHGVVIEDQNYLPVRFMPGHPANPVSG